MHVYLLKFYFVYVCDCGCGQRYDQPAEALVKADNAVEAWEKLEAHKDTTWESIFQLGQERIHNGEEVLILQ